MGDVLAAAVFEQEIPTDKIGQPGAGLDASMPSDGATGRKFSPRQEISEFPEPKSTLKGHAQQPGNDIVQRHRLAGDVGTFDAENDLSRLRIVVDGEIQNAMTGDTNFLGSMIPAVGEDEALAHGLAFDDDRQTASEPTP
jgi:hypothetical protein